MVHVKGSFRLESQRFRIERTGSEKNSISCPLSTCSALLASLAMPIRREGASICGRGREDIASPFIRLRFYHYFPVTCRHHRGIWSALLSLLADVPDSKNQQNDRKDCDHQHQDCSYPIAFLDVLRNIFFD